MGRSRPGPGPGTGPTGSAAGKGAADGEREEENAARGGGCGGGERWWSPEYGSIAAASRAQAVVASGWGKWHGVWTLDGGGDAVWRTMGKVRSGLVCDVCVSGGAEEGSSLMGRNRLSTEQYGSPPLRPQLSPHHGCASRKCVLFWTRPYL